ncbi:hypothetical protein HN011_006867 [Eciton burchellii]|nr:hypothetical protein HN011_006867 [Eciton burchellii]
MSTRCANDLIVRELREELRKLGLVATGCRRELVIRLNRSTSSGTWSELPIEAQMTGSMVEIANEGSSHEQLEIISDRGAAFTSNEFKSYCKEENIEHVLITTGIPRSNGQVERVNRTLIPLLSKLTDPERGEWYKHLGVAQQCINTTLHRSLGTSPFNVLFGTRAQLRNKCEIREMLKKEWINEFQEDRDEIRDHAKNKIAKIQEENRREYNKKRKKASIYCEKDLVAIKRTQQGPGFNLANKYLGPYEIVKILRNNRYIVRKVGDHEGPWETSTAADYIKPWAKEIYQRIDNALDREELKE